MEPSDESDLDKRCTQNNSLLSFYNMHANDENGINLGPSSRCSISTRHSSVSIQIELENGSQEANRLMPPAERFTLSRLSSGSAWDSFRLSMVSFSKVFLVAPCSRHKCCLGCISLNDAIPLICVAELFTLVFLGMVVLDFWITDGKTFYTFYFEGYGNQIAAYYSVFVSISVPVLIVSLIAWSQKKKYLYVFHILWQWTVVEILLFYSYTVFKWVQKSGGSHTNGILLPSAFVLGGASFFGALIESWWLFVFVDAMFFEQQSNERKYSSSGQSKNKSTRGRTRNEFESETSDSRRNSVSIPVVKIDRSHMLDWRSSSISGDIFSPTSSSQSRADHV